MRIIFDILINATGKFTEHKNYSLESYSYCYKSKKKFIENFIGRIVKMIEKNVENFCSKTVSIVESWLLCQNLCSMLKCSFTKKHTSHDKNWKTQSNEIETKPQIPRLRREKKREWEKERPMSSLLHVRINIERNQTFESKPPKLIRLGTYEQLPKQFTEYWYESFCNRNAIEKGLPSENKTNRFCRRIAITNERTSLNEWMNE